MIETMDVAFGRSISLGFMRLRSTSSIECLSPLLIDELIVTLNSFHY